MRWFRSNRGGVAWFGVFCAGLSAFAFVRSRAMSAKFSGGSAAWAAAETGKDAAADVPPSSPQKNPIGLAGDFCAICANISLANTLVLPILAIILAPVYSPRRCRGHWRRVRRPRLTTFLSALAVPPRLTYRPEPAAPLGFRGGDSPCLRLERDWFAHRRDLDRADHALDSRSRFDSSQVKPSQVRSNQAFGGTSS